MPEIWGKLIGLYVEVCVYGLVFLYAVEHSGAPHSVKSLYGKADIHISLETLKSGPYQLVFPLRLLSGA